MTDGVCEENLILERQKHADSSLEHQWSQSRANCEQITLVWLDGHVFQNGAFTDDIRLTQELLRELNDYVILFDDESKCLTYVNSVRNETLLIIIAGSCATPNLLDTLHKLRYVDSIFIFCQNAASYEPLLSNGDYHKLVGIFNEQISLASSIKQTIELVDRQTTMFTLLKSEKQKSMRDLSREVGSFIFLQLVKQVIKQMVLNNASSSESKQEMIDKCRMYYRGNAKEMKNIDEFERNYTSDQAVKWYTRDSFIYKLINKALRTEDVDALYTYRFFIVDLCACLTNGCQQLRDVFSNITTYRGMKMSQAAVQQFRESIGHHISVNGYFSTSRQRSVAEVYAGIEERKRSAALSDALESVLLVIDVDLDAHPDMVLAYVRHLSTFRDEDEILFDLGTVFKIEAFDSDDEERCWICRLTGSDEGRAVAKGYLDFKQAELDQSVDIETVFGDLLHDMGEWHKSLAYFERLLLRRTDDPQVHLGIARSCDTLSRTDEALSHLKQAYTLVMGANQEWLTLAAKICHYTCRVYYMCNNFVDALDYNRKALKLYRRVGEDSNRNGIALAMVSAGLIYFLQCEHDVCLRYFQEALQIFREVYSFDHPDKTTALFYTSHSLYLRGEYEEALKYSLDCLAMNERLLPKDHPSIFVSIACVGKLLYKQGKYLEALERFHQAAELYEKRKADTTRTYALVLNNIGKTLYRLNRLDEASVHYDRASDLIQKLFLAASPDHADLAYTWKNIGEIHLVKHDGVGALQRFEQARDMYKRLFTVDGSHRDIAKCWHLIGETHVILKNHTDALHAYETALRMWMDKLPPHHPDIALCHQSLGEFYAQPGRDVSKAVEQFRQALSVYEMQAQMNFKQLETIRRRLADLNTEST